MAVIASKTEPKCKLCVHAERIRIDELIEMRSKRLKDEQGVTVNLPYVLAALAELGVQNPTEENVKNHWKKHCEVVKEETKEALDSHREQALDELRQRAKSMSLEELMEWVARQGVEEAMLRELLDGKSGVTLDHSMKAVDTLTRRKQENAQRKFFEAVGGGIAMALTGGTQTKQLGERGEVVREIDAAPDEVQEVPA